MGLHCFIKSIQFPKFFLLRCNHLGKGFFGKDALTFDAGKNLGFQGNQVFLGFIPLYLNSLQMILAFDNFPLVTPCNDLLFRDASHFGEDLTDCLINDLIQNMYRVTRLPGAAGLLTELSVTGITDTERIVASGIEIL